MKIKSFKRYKQSEVNHLMESISAEYQKQVSNNIKRGIAQAKLRKQAKQNGRSHE